MLVFSCHYAQNCAGTIDSSILQTSLHPLLHERFWTWRWRMDYRDKICTLIHLSKRRYYDTFFENNTVNMKKIHQGISKLSQLICYGYILDTSCILWNNSQLFQQRDPWQPHDQLQSCVPFPFFANPYHRRQLLLGDGLQIDQKISGQFFF